jgi:hypothetical protein
MWSSIDAALHDSAIAFENFSSRKANEKTKRQTLNDEKEIPQTIDNSSIKQAQQ